MPDNSQDESFKEKDRWNMISIYLNGLLFISKLVVGIMTMAISIISDSIDSGIDVITSAMARYSVKKAHEPADEDHSYGHGKYENLSGLIQAIVIILIALAIILEAGRRMIVGVLLENLDIGIAIMVVSVITKLGLSQKMLGVAKKHESIAMEANACNLRADVWISLGVLVSLVVIRLAGPHIEKIEYIDPVFAIIIGLVIMRAAFGIAKRSSRDLLDGQLPPEELAAIQEVLDRNKIDYLEYHRLRARKSGSERHIDMHLVVPKDTSLEDAHKITDEIEKEIQARINNTTVVIHVEPCLGECKACQNLGKH